MSEQNIDGTYELIGPKVQCNHYGLPSFEVSVNIDKKGVIKPVKVPRQYLIPHGKYCIKDFPYEQLIKHENPLKFIREYIVSRNIEGLVFRHQNDNVFYKVNRNHIGVPLQKGQVLSLF